jgi:hypothetical protein
MKLIKYRKDERDAFPDVFHLVDPVEVTVVSETPAPTGRDGVSSTNSLTPPEQETCTMNTAKCRRKSYDVLKTC